MLMPSLFSNKFFDEWLDFPLERELNNRNPLFGKGLGNLRTDIKETDEAYLLDVEMPGFKKEEVSAEFEDGYLTINAKKTQENETKDENEKYVKKERYSGECKRTYYMGQNIDQEKISAKFEDGILKLNVPKINKEIEEKNKYIRIEG